MLAHYARPKLAQAYLDQLREGEEPIALFSPRRTGKTAFLRKDLMPAGEAAGFWVVYADIWQDKTSPVAALTYALQTAVDDIKLPHPRTGRGMATPVKKVSVLGTGVDFGDDAKRVMPESKYLRLDALLRELVRECGKKVLLLIDEVQQLAQVDDGEEVVASLRASLTQLQGQVYTVLTGSSRDQLNELFSRARAPMYEFASVIKFPLLGRDFVKFALLRFAHLTGRSLDEPVVLAAFEALEHRPKLLQRLLDEMEANSALSVAAALGALSAEREKEHNFPGQWRDLSALQQAVLVRIALDEDLYSKTALLDYQQRLGTPVNPGSVNNAVDQLRKKGLISKIGRDLDYESRAFLSYVRHVAAKPAE
jgi:DNA-binding MarR family transcriptional regulator